MLNSASFKSRKMKYGLRSLLLFINLFLIHTAFGQSQESFDKLISETNTFLDSYESLRAFGSDDHYISFKESGLPEKLINAITSDEDYMDGISNDKDSISEFNLIVEYQGLIFENLEKIIAHDKFMDNDIQELIGQSELSVIRSDDGKLYNFSMDEKTGGTYRSRISVMHFTEINQDSLPTLEELEKGLKINPYLVFEGDGFNEIHTLETEEGTKYLLIGSVRGCSYCFESNIMLVKFKEGLFYQEFGYSVNSRSWEEGIAYDPTSKIITVDYITDDLTRDCDCTNYAAFEKDENDYSYEEDMPITKSCHCTFEFNGVNFELIKESWELVKE